MSESLFAGPFVGEFGHELFCWQGVLRAMAPNYSLVTIVCTPGKEALYEDFADELLSYDPQQYIPNGAFNRGITKDYPAPPTGFKGRHLGPNQPLTDYLKRNGLYRYCPVKPAYKKQNFIKLGASSKALGYDYIIHARFANRAGARPRRAYPNEKANLKAQSKRNWAAEKWTEVVSQLPGTKASVGTQEAALHVSGTEDLRDLNLRELCNILNSSGMILGPSSGPLHLATLCGLPQLVWSGEPGNKKRYQKDWNPHNTPTFYLDKPTWDPLPTEVLRAIEAFSHQIS